MTLDPRTIEACAKVAEQRRKYFVVAPDIRSFVTFSAIEAGAAIRALAGEQSVQVQVCACGCEKKCDCRGKYDRSCWTSPEGRTYRDPIIQSSDGGMERRHADPRGEPSENPAGARCDSHHHHSESDPVVTQDYAPAGTALTAEERQLVDGSRSQAARYANAQTVFDLAGIIDRLTKSSPAEVSEDELARTLCCADGTGQCAAICLSHSSIFTSDGKCPEANRIWRHKARALLAKFTIGRRV